MFVMLWVLELQMCQHVKKTYKRSNNCFGTIREVVEVVGYQSAHTILGCFGE